MHLNELIRKMEELRHAVEEGERAAALLDECRGIAERHMDPGHYYRVNVGTYTRIERVYRLTRDGELRPDYLDGPPRTRPVIEAADVYIDPDLLVGSRAFPSATTAGEESR